MGRRPNRMAVAGVALIALGLGLRAAAAIWWQQRLPATAAFAFGDSHSYWILGRQIAHGEPYVYAQSRAFRAPGYPLVLAPLFWANSDPPVLAARLMGALLGVLAMMGVMLLGAQLFSLRVAILAGGLTAVYPGAVGMSVFVLSEALFCPLMLGQLVCWTAAWRAPAARSCLAWSVAAGLLAGLATLARPSWILFTPLAAGVGMFAGRRRSLSVATVLLAVLALTLLPWWVRNLRVTGTFVVTTLETGASLYDGLNPAADGGSDMEFVDRFRRAQGLEDAGRESPHALPPDVRLDRRMRAAALAWAREHPGRVLELMGIKFWRMWSPWPHAAELGGWPMRLVVAAGYLPLLVCGVWGACRYSGNGWPYVLALLPVVYFTALHMVFASSIRYREPVMLLLAVYAAAVLDGILAVRSRSWRLWPTNVE